MKEEEAKKIIKDIPVGSKLQLIKSNGDIIDVVLASHETESVEEKKYDNLTVPALPPAITVQGGRWGTYRIDLDDIVKIAHVGERRGGKSG